MRRTRRALMIAAAVAALAPLGVAPAVVVSAGGRPVHVTPGMMCKGARITPADGTPIPACF